MKDYKEIFLREKLRRVAQDKDIEDKEGTQPKKYYAGDMSKATKEKRAAHFKKKKSGPAPGDAGAKTKPSKHTLNYKKMYGEEENEAVSPAQQAAIAIAKKEKEKKKQQEKLDPKKDDAGDYIDDFRKSDAPQFKGKSDKKIRKMAIAAYLKDKEKSEKIDEVSFDSLTSAQKTQLYKLYSKGMKLPSGSPEFKKNKAEIDKLRSKLKLEEGINDPSIFKAVFLAGGPGSGKSFIVGQTGLVSLGMKLINSDPAFEKALKKAGLTTNPEDIMSPEGQTIRGKATKLTDIQKSMYIKGRLGLVIDGTGKDFKKILTQKRYLDQLGYDCAMIFVNTDLETALDRNRNRARKLPDDQVEKMWKSVQKNIGRFQNTFKTNFYVVDNSDGADFARDSKRVYKDIKSWAAKPPKNSIGKDWISQAKKQRGIREDYSIDIYEDHESKMALTQLRALADKAEQLSDELIGLLRDSPNQDIELEAWVQAKITKASDYMTSVYDYMMYSEKED